MMNGLNKRFACWLLVCAFLLTASTTAFAQGQTRDHTPDFAAQSELEEVAAELEELWAENPHVFRQLAAIRGAVVETHIQSGYRPINVARYLDGIDEDAILVLLWALAVEEPRALGMELQTWRMWRIGLLEALGRLRDERSIPVLQSLIEDEPFPSVRQAATSALGRLDDEQSIAAAIEVARMSPEKRDAIVAGLGNARRQVALDYLMEVLGAADNTEEQRKAVRAIGDWANQWAWQTSSREAYRGEGQKGRQRIIDRLVDLYPSAGEEVRAEIKKSLQLAGAAHSEQRATQRADAATDPAVRADLMDLAAKMAQSPMD